MQSADAVLCVTFKFRALAVKRSNQRISSVKALTILRNVSNKFETYPKWKTELQVHFRYAEGVERVLQVFQYDSTQTLKRFATHVWTFHHLVQYSNRVYSH